MLGRFCGVLAALAFLMLGGCATVNNNNNGNENGAPKTTAQKDPWEGWNRKVFGFNEGLDEHVLKPVAKTYRDIVPEPARNVVTHVITNVSDGWSAVNHLLQGKWQSGFEMTVRFMTNTFLGFGGMLDIATEAGLDSRPEDFGQTLGRWGFVSGPYIVWPVLGPSTVRDSAGLTLDLQATPASFVHDTPSKVGVLTLQVVNTRANLLGASKVIDDIAFDKYSFMRDAYLARRRSLVYDGSPPPSPDEDDEKDPDQAAPAAAAPEAPAAPAAPASAASGAGR